MTEGTDKFLGKEPLLTIERLDLSPVVTVSQGGFERVGKPSLHPRLNDKSVHKQIHYLRVYWHLVLCKVVESTVDHYPDKPGFAQLFQFLAYGLHGLLMLAY